ncbi:MAG: cytochrome c maturation protein CcmE [bacterium]
MKKRNYRAIAGVLLVLTVAGYLVFKGISETGVYYWTVSEVLAGPRAKTDRSIRISGNVVDGTINYSQKSLLLAFTVSDMEDPTKTIDAKFNGPAPDALKAGVEVILEGTYNRENNTFMATVLLAKCPSKYESEVSES